jgi:hypothetical protein
MSSNELRSGLNRNQKVPYFCSDPSDVNLPSASSAANKYQHAFAYSQKQPLSSRADLSSTPITRESFKPHSI